MAYSVVGADGKEYGPVEVPALQAWLTEKRLTPESIVKDFMTGRQMKLAEVPGIVTAPPIAQPMGAQPMAGQASPYAGPSLSGYASPTVAPAKDNSGWLLAGILFRCGGALLLFFVLHGIGLITGGYALFYAIQNRNEKHGTLGLIVAGVTLLLIGIGWALRLNTFAGSAGPGY
jgi:hypothetical protein